MAAEENLESAARDRARLEREQRRRIAWIGLTAASYAIDTLFLGLFALAGTIPGTVAAGYGTAAVAACSVTYLATRKGWNLRLRDPSLVAPLNGLGIALQLGVVLAAPQVAFPFLANLFTVFAFGMIWLSVRHSVIVWTLGMLGSAAVFYLVGPRMAFPASSPAVLALVWLYFSAILGRCLLLSVSANEMRERLADSRRRLAATLGKAEELASHDELTGALNRRALLAALERERGRAERARATFSIAMIDLDRFKSINDTHGHSAGDEVLRDFVRTVHAVMRVTDIFGRYGGEEFMLVLVGAASAPARQALERIRAAVGSARWPAEVSVTFSAGVASFRSGESVEALLHRADMALYQAKSAGRDAIVAVG